MAPSPERWLTRTVKSARPGGATEGGRASKEQQKSQKRELKHQDPGAAQEDRDGRARRRQYKNSLGQEVNDGDSRKKRGQGRRRGGIMEQEV